MSKEPFRDKIEPREEANLASNNNDSDCKEENQNEEKSLKKQELKRSFDVAFLTGKSSIGNEESCSSGVKSAFSKVIKSSSISPAASCQISKRYK